MVEQLSKVYGVSQVCRILGLARSTFYYESHERADTPCFEHALRQQAGQHPVEGSRRLAARLRR
jgi:hypothetical protein